MATVRKPMFGSMPRRGNYGARWRRGMFGGPSSGAAILLSDLFPEANGTNLSGKALTGGTWTVHGGSGWDVQSGQANPTAEPGGGLWATAVANAGVASVRMSVKTASFYGGLIGRAVDVDNYWLLAHNSTAMGINERTAAGGYVERATGASSLAAGHRLEFEFRGNVITARHYDAAEVLQLELTFTSATHNTATNFGIAAIGVSADARLDEFYVYA